MKKVLAVLAAMAVAVLSLAGCGGTDDKKAATETKVLKVGATAVPHAEILEQIKDDLKAEGIDLQVVEFNDYVQPNLALNDKELDANYFQHAPYLENFVKEHPEVKLANAAGIHIEPMGIYSHKVKSLNEVKDGATVAIPNDPTNGGRALILLSKAGLITLKDNNDIAATVNDITANPKNLKFQELEAAQVPRSIDDVDLAVINSNFAMQVPLNPVKDSLYIEDATSPYVNIVAVRQGDEERPEIKALIKALQSEKVKKFIEEKYQGAVVATF
ncbi:MAG: MetQ/NlpA family ABC transporter substrate-binding protein [Veillonellaceae bacterium]|nr:MetQ/NlpA family ABC transporter substrate-binding protein [Veillonellaceae bacterium]MDD6849522.1 MetQ/NlpA family ABC transporter substrate-binding protein [Veillonellaceae bacterium]MDD7655752.1 MetQ/NlpA family ABC transporter substrate-binding protein [Veillonellaceae bacterium]